MPELAPETTETGLLLVSMPACQGVCPRTESARNRRWMLDRYRSPVSIASLSQAGLSWNLELSTAGAPPRVQVKRLSSPCGQQFPAALGAQRQPNNLDTAAGYSTRQQLGRAAIRGRGAAAISRDTQPASMSTSFAFGAPQALSPRDPNQPTSGSGAEQAIKAWAGGASRIPKPGAAAAGGFSTPLEQKTKVC